MAVDFDDLCHNPSNEYCYIYWEAGLLLPVCMMCIKSLSFYIVLHIKLITLCLIKSHVTFSNNSIKSDPYQ